MTRMMRWFVLAVAALVPFSVSAQESDSELLRAILCELKELRAAVRQGQVFAPLVDANLREREQVQGQVAGLRDRVSELEQVVEEQSEQQVEIRLSLRSLPVRDGRTMEKEEAEQFEKEMSQVLERLTKQLEMNQRNYHRAMSEQHTAEARLRELKTDFDQLQRQMRSVAAAGGEVCAGP